MEELTKLIITFISSAVFGGLAGSLVNMRMQKKNLSIQFVKESGERYYKESLVLGYLSKPDLYNWSSVDNEERIAVKKKRLNEIREMTNWYNMLSFLYVNNHLNRKIIEASGLDDNISKFCEDINCKPRFTEWRKEWPCLANFKLKNDIWHFFRPKERCERREKNE